MNDILVLLEKYFNVVESLILSEILTEGEIFDILNKLNIKIDADLKAIQSKKYVDNDKAKFKKTIFDTVSLMQRARQLYDRKFDDNNTQKIVYQYYKKNLLPKFTDFWKLCAEHNNRLKLNEEEGLRSIKSIIDAMNNGTTEQLGLKSVKTYFKY